MPTSTVSYLLAAAVVVLAVLLWRERTRRRSDATGVDDRVVAAEAVIAGAVDAIITSDAHGRIESFNRAAQRLFGYEEGEVMGRNLRMLMPAPHRDRHDDYMRAYHDTGVRKIIGIGREVECLRSDGSVFWGDLAVSETRSNDQVRFTGVIRDLTARKEAEATIENALRRLNLALGAGRLVAWEYRGDLREFQFNQPGPEPETHRLVPERVSFEGAMERVHEADRGRVSALFASDAPVGSVREIEYRVVTSQGETHWIHNHMLARARGRSDKPDWIGISRDFTESRRAENRAMTLGRILEASRNEIYVFSADRLRFSLVNQSARENLGYTSDELTEMTPLNLARDMRHEEFYHLLEPLSDGTSSIVNFASRLYRKDGTSYPVDVNVVRSAMDEDAVYVAIALDITDQEHFLRRLRRKEEEHRLTVDYAPLGISTMNVRGRIEAVNKAGLRLTGYTDETLTGRRGLRYIHPDDRAATVVAFERLVSGELPYTMIPHRLRTRDGDYVFVQTHYAAVHNSRGEPDRIIAMHQDLTDQQAREKEIEQHREKLAHVSRLGTMGQMAAGLAHEINQPLAAIATYAQACQRLLDRGDADRGDFAHALEQVSQQAHRAGDVIRRMRSLARGNTSVRESCHIRNLIYELMPLVNMDARHANVEMRLDIPAEIPTVYADPVQIQQVLLNLVRNGVDAMRRIPADTKTLNIKARLEDDAHIRVAVTDRGNGVSEEAIDHLFDPFFTTKKSGMGMGLSISRSIIKAHGGRIGYEPVSEGGSTFWFTIPVEASKEMT